MLAYQRLPKHGAKARGQLRRFTPTSPVDGFGGRFVQRVAQGDRRRRPALCGFALHLGSAQWQQLDPPRQPHSMRMLLAEWLEGRLVGKQGIDHINDGWSITPGFIARQKARAKTRLQEGRGRREKARFGAAKAVNRLLGIADKKDRRPCSIGIGIKPGKEDLPLQRVGVLKLVEQHVAVACIEPRLDEGRTRLVGEQLQHAPFGIDEIDLPTLRLEGFQVCDEGLMHQQGIAVESQIALLLSQRLCGNKPFREGVVMRHRLCRFRRTEALRHGVGAVRQQFSRRAVGGQGSAAKRFKTGFSSRQVQSREQPLCHPRLGLVAVQEQIGADARIRCRSGCKKGSHSLPRITGTGEHTQGVEQGGSRLRFVARAGQPFGAA